LHCIDITNNVYIPYSQFAIFLRRFIYLLVRLFEFLQVVYLYVVLSDYWSINLKASEFTTMLLIVFVADNNVGAHLVSAAGNNADNDKKVNEFNSETTELRRQKKVIYEVVV